MSDAELIAAGGLLACYAATGTNDHGVSCFGNTLAERVRDELAWRHAVRTETTLFGKHDCQHTYWRKYGDLHFCRDCAKEMT